jgi:hypothetical protein
MTNQTQTTRRGGRLLRRTRAAFQAQIVRPGRRPSSNRPRRLDQPFAFDTELHVSPPFALPPAGPR